MLTFLNQFMFDNYNDPLRSVWEANKKS